MSHCYHETNKCASALTKKTLIIFQDFIIFYSLPVDIFMLSFYDNMGVYYERSYPQTSAVGFSQFLFMIIIFSTQKKKKKKKSYSYNYLGHARLYLNREIYGWISGQKLRNYQPMAIQREGVDQAQEEKKKRKKSETKLKETFGLSYRDKHYDINLMCFIFVGDCENYYLLLFPRKK